MMQQLSNLYVRINKLWHSFLDSAQPAFRNRKALMETLLFANYLLARFVNMSYELLCCTNHWIEMYMHNICEYINYLLNMEPSIKKLLYIVVSITNRLKRALTFSIIALTSEKLLKLVLSRH